MEGVPQPLWSKVCNKTFLSDNIYLSRILKRHSHVAGKGGRGENLTNLMEAKPVRVDEVGFHRVTACVTNTTESNIHNVWGSLSRDPCTASIVKFIDGNCQWPTLRAPGLCQCIKSGVVQRRTAPCIRIKKSSSVSSLGHVTCGHPQGAPSYSLWPQGSAPRVLV